MTTDEIRAMFLKFFEARGHRIVASDTLAPAKDPSILFTGAGMNQFKEQFLGRNISFRNAATSQKCLRTADLENVGRTAGHHTFFEMLGNFSFGGYFKKEAIAWAWEFMTGDLKIPAGKLSVSVYEGDEEAYNIWLNEVRVPRVRILKMGDKDNFWPSEAKRNGPNGPCGPCSEIFYDGVRGEPIEVWNLVFTQFDRKEGGVLEDLPAKNIDTGMGLERLASVMQGTATNFEIDIFIPIIETICRYLEYKKGSDPQKTAHINAIADHIRAVTFAVGDGIYPSNEERGFVIRKLIRKSTQRALQVRPGCGSFLYKLVPSVARVMKNQYPELEAKREIISQIIKSEGERFQNIIAEVLPLLREEFEHISRAGGVRGPGEVIFRYSDEKGVPLDLQREMAGEIGIELDTEGFEKFLLKQKERSRAKSKISKEIFAAPAGLARKADEEWDEASKTKIRINHTATHLLHSALRKVLGEHVWQSGSLVYPDRLRFDFSHPKKVDRDEILKVEALVNEHIAKGLEIKKEAMTLEEAKKQGAIALFGEKYGEEVIVRTIGDFSKELCGGDHIDNTGRIRVFKITMETSVAAGTRRIEAVTGDGVYDWLVSRARKLAGPIKSASGLEKWDTGLAAKAAEKTRELDAWLSKKNKQTVAYEDVRQWAGIEEELLKLIEKINSLKKRMSRESARQKEKSAAEIIENFVKGARDIKGVPVITGMVRGFDGASLRNLLDETMARAADAVILLASDEGGKAGLVMAVGGAALKKGLSARELIKPVAARVGGSGGGRPEMAQAGGRDVSKIGEALNLIYSLIAEKI